ncbi:MAG TPA: alpha/beta fold hydrolase [Candidatus Binataceae bacterium]|nr:alpha/beta fold hydrolase [Candidatus Binataceae bacterium]
MPTVRVRDINLYYESHGGGAPLLMIMGLGSSALSWEPALIADLARGFRTIVCDNRGTGRSDKPREEYSIPAMADDAAALLDALGIARAHVFGVSMGGMIAQELALNHPARVQTLTLGCTTAGGRNAVPAPPESMKILMAPRAGLSDADIIRRAWPLGYTEGYIRSHRDVLEAAITRVLQHPTPPYAYKLQLDSTFKFKTYDRLPQITAPTLVITGAEDVLIPARNSEIIAERIPGAQVHIIPGAGHQFFHEKREEFVAALTEFLRAHPLGG